MNQRFLSKAISGRLPVYLQYLRDQVQSGVDQISATSISKALRYGEVQVRKDLNLIAGTGKPGSGYKTAELLASLEASLGCGMPKDIILVGNSPVSFALLHHPGMNIFNFAVAAVFDIIPDPVSSDPDPLFEDIPYYDLSLLSEYCRIHSIHAAVITVPQETAQQVCDILVNSGITVIWNLTGKILQVPDHIQLLHDSLLSSLAYLSGQINFQNPVIR